MSEIDKEYGMNFEKLQQYLFEKAQSGELSPYEYEQLKKTNDVTYKTGYANREGYEKKEVPNYELGSVAYSYILDNGGTPDEALEYSMTLQDKTVDWLKEVKNRNVYEDNSRRIVDEHSEHPIQQEMVKNKVFDKTNMSNIKRVNTLIRKLSQCKNVYDKIKTLEEITELQQEEINRFKTQSIHNEARFKALKDSNHLKDVEPKDLARMMFDQDCKQKDVAEATGRSLPTVKRWWKEFKNDT